MSRDEETVLIPLEQLGAIHSERAQDEEAASTKSQDFADCATPCVGVQSVGDTHFGDTRLGDTHFGSRGPEGAGILSPNDKAQEVDALNESPPLSSLKKRGRRAQRLPLWAWGLVAGGAAGLVSALVFRPSLSGAASSRVATPSQLVSEGKKEPSSPSAAVQRKDPEEVTPGRAVKPKNQETSGKEKPREGLQRLSHEALLLQLSGECQKAALVYQELAEAPGVPSLEGGPKQWRHFASAARASCKPVSQRLDRAKE